MSYGRAAWSGLWVPEHLLRHGAEEPLRAVVGRVRCYLTPAAGGRRRLVYEGHNVFTGAGYARMASWLGSGIVSGVAATVSAPTYVAVGTGAGTPAFADTAMFGEIARKAATQYAVQSLYTARVTANFGTTEGNGVLTEIGLCDSAGYPVNAVGTATGYTTTTLTDSGAAWTTNQWAGSTLYVVGATTGSGQKAVIASNTATVLTFPAITLPTGTVTYRVGGPTLFAHATVALTKTSANALQVIWQLVLPSS